MATVVGDWRSLVAEREPSRVILGPNGEPYMEHYTLSRHTRLHRILQSDPQDPHDHPWAFRSTILEGSYREWSEVGARVFGPGDELVRVAREVHRLELVDGPVWTFFRFGQYQRTWGFHTAEGWVPYRRYLREHHDG